MVSLRAFWGEKWAKMGNKGENEAMGIWGMGVGWGLALGTSEVFANLSDSVILAAQGLLVAACHSFNSIRPKRGQ